MTNPMSLVIGFAFLLTVGGLSSAFSNAKMHPGNRWVYLLKNYPACT
jgi:hypothetical protein